MSQFKIQISKKNIQKLRQALENQDAIWGDAPDSEVIKLLFLVEDRWSVVDVCDKVKVEQIR